MDEELKKLVTEISEYNVNELIKESKEFNFKEIKELLEDLIDRISSLQQNPEFFQTIMNLQQIKNSLNQLKQTLQRIKDFDATKISNPTAEKQNLINSIKNLNNDLDNLFLQRYQLYLSRKKPEKENIKKLEKQLRDKIKVFEDKEKEINKILDSVKEKSGQIGITEYESVFNEEAKSNKIVAYIWLGVSGLILISFLYLFKKWFIDVSINSTDFNYFHEAINRVVFLAIGGYALFQSVKNYNARMHLYVRNQHRRNCLRVFEKIRNSAFEQETKDEILKIASKSIFESGETGFVSTKEDSGGLETINIIEKIGRSIK